MSGKGNERRLRWFTWGVTTVLILVCNALLFVGLWISGVNLEVVLSNPQFYDPANGHCIRVGWADVKGMDQPVRLCTEWLEMSDPTGTVHTLREGKSIAYGNDGKLYYEDEVGGNYRFLGLVLFIVLVLFSGMWVKQSLISWYRFRWCDTALTRGE